MAKEVSVTYRKPMIMHYYIEGKQIKVLLSNNTVISYPYSTKKELEIINTIKKQITKLEKSRKRMKRVSNLWLGGSLLCLGAFAAEIAALAINRTEANTSDLLFIGTTAGLSLLNGYEHDSFVGDIKKTEKNIFFMQHHNEVYSALVNEFYKAFGKDAHTSEIDPFNVDDIYSYSLDELKGFASLKLKKA